MREPNVLLVSCDDHTLGAQTVASIVSEQSGIRPTLAYLPSHLSRYPAVILDKILKSVAEEVLSDGRKTIVGLSLRELSFGRSHQLAQAMKERFGDEVTIVAGGSFSTATAGGLPNEFDHAIVGAGEGILPIIEAAVRGERADRTIVRSSSAFHYPQFGEALVLDAFGHVARGLSRPLSHAQYKQTSAVEMVAGIGCTYACSFCEVSVLKNKFGRNYKIVVSSPDQLIDVLDRQVAAVGAKYVYFFDEDFLLKSKRWIDEFASLYAARIGLPFFIFATPASVMNAREKLWTLGEVGLDTVNMGVQSGSATIAQGLYDRKKDNGIVTDAVAGLVELHRRGRLASPPMLDLIALNPFETKDDVARTLDLLLALPTPFEAVVHCMSFFEGTELKRLAVRNGTIPGSYTFQFDLHDFRSRVARNEFALNYNDDTTLAWLNLNALLHRSNGLHEVRHGVRWLGGLTEREMRREMTNRHAWTIERVLNGIQATPDVVSDILYPWERQLAGARPRTRSESVHASAAAG